MAIKVYFASDHAGFDAKNKHLDILMSTREHNNANALSLGLRFLTLDQAKDAVTPWLAAPFLEEARHARRIMEIDEIRNMFSRYELL